MNSIEKTWRLFLKEIIVNGEKHEKDDGDIIYESMINHAFIPSVLKQYGNQNIPIDMFLKMVKDGVFNIEGYPVKDLALYDYVKSLDDKEIRANKNFSTGEDKFTYTYPNRIFHMTDRDSDFFVNQFALMVNRLTPLKKRDDGDGLMYWSGSNRAVANIYSAPKDCDMKDIPCLQILQATVRRDRLVLHCYFRSNDCYGAFPSNMLFLMYFGLKLVDCLKRWYPSLVFEGVSYNSSSLHVYEGDLVQARSVLGL